MPMRTASGWPHGSRWRADLLPHGQGHLGHRLGVVGPGLGQPADGHVGVADGLDLLQPVALGQPVEGGEQVVEDLHHPLRAAAVAAGRVKPTRSAKSTVTSGNRSAMTASPCLSRAAIGAGRTLSSSRSERSCSTASSAAAAHRLPQQQHRRQQREVGDGAVHQPRGEAVGEVGDGQEDQRGAAEPGHQPAPRRGSPRPRRWPGRPTAARPRTGPGSRAGCRGTGPPPRPAAPAGASAAGTGTGRRSPGPSA